VRIRKEKEEEPERGDDGQGNKRSVFWRGDPDENQLYERVGESRERGGQ